MILEERLREHCLSPTTTSATSLWRRTRQQLNLETMAESDAGAQNIHEVRLFSVSTVLQTQAVRKRILKSFRLEGHFQKFHKASGD